MSRTLRRPMFRRGGPANDGIMSGIEDRKQLANGTLNPDLARTQAEDIINIMNELSPVKKTPLPLGTVGFALASGADPIDALGLGYQQFVKKDDARQALLDKRKQAAVSTAIGSQLSKKQQSVLAAEKKARFLLPPDATPEQIRAKTAEIIQSEMTGKTYSDEANFRRSLEAYRSLYGDGNKAFYHAAFDERVSPTLRGQGKAPKGRIKIKDGEYDTKRKTPGVYVDVDNGKVIEITPELEAIELPELSKLLI